MKDPQALLDRMWQDYLALNPGARAIYELLTGRGETIFNDHIALRTLDFPELNLEALSKPFRDAGYEERGAYDFPAKKLNARHYEHPDPDQPKVFISELRTGDCSERTRRLLGGLALQVPPGFTRDAYWPAAGRPWRLPWVEYEALRAESEYAAWVAAFGFRANHFTVDVNRLEKFADLASLNTFLKDQGVQLNTSGGEIKGSPEDYLEQSSTLADEVPVEFMDETHTIPACYYEFARRYPLPDGSLFQGFVAKSADKIFESTDVRAGS